MGVAHLRGSAHRDAWRHARKSLTERWHYGCDIDFAIVAPVYVDGQRRHRVVAHIDVKQPHQQATFTEVAAYLTELEAGRRVYIVEYWIDYDAAYGQQRLIEVDDRGMVTRITVQADWDDVDLAYQNDFGRLSVYEVVAGDERNPSIDTITIGERWTWQQYSEWETETRRRLGAQ